ncbi:uncharacterized protein I303_103354 [Kwoniella dejecticola CBS 10117]|uniref:Uncharacterized protein n=1 Tax=Kwoniella dejecticola CBS 10117 TaxID=1296121 RepID=A0A1A6A6I1_9TREE|nr:uncharacterized protein I303_03377 [Kwoniella dejecticola CBS 10117]OBR85666.1 hypothetical protein I303_03377 [Kwoniella dejecticola CBS 10117]
MAAVAQAPPMLPSNSSAGSISRPSSSSAITKPTETKGSNTNQTSKTEASDNAPVAKVTVSEATPVDEKGQVKKENGDAPFLLPASEIEWVINWLSSHDILLQHTYTALSAYL